MSAAKEDNMLALITTQIQAYLNGFAASFLNYGTLIIVPSGGLKKSTAVPTEFEDKKTDGLIEYDQLVRLWGKEVGEGEMFWQDEEMAHRLAARLEPARDLKNEPLPPREEEASSAPESSRRGLWSRMRSLSKTSQLPPITVKDDPKPLDPARVEKHWAEVEQVNKDVVKMVIKADEVVFRYQNEFSIFESQRGWCIVLRLQVVPAKN